MHAVVWVTEATWEGCAERAGALLPGDAEVTLLHVSPADVEELAAARDRLGRAAQLDVRTGRVEREVLGACADADLLVLARDGREQLGPPSLGKRTRFVVDHAACAVLLVWGGPAPAPERMHWPPHLR